MQSLEPTHCKIEANLEGHRLAVRSLHSETEAYSHFLSSRVDCRVEAAPFVG